MSMPPCYHVGILCPACACFGPVPLDGSAPPNVVTTGDERVRYCGQAVVYPALAGWSPPGRIWDLHIITSTNQNRLTQEHATAAHSQTGSGPLHASQVARTLPSPILFPQPAASGGPNCPLIPDGCRCYIRVDQALRAVKRKGRRLASFLHGPFPQLAPSKVYVPRRKRKRKEKTRKGADIGSSLLQGAGAAAGHNPARRSGVVAPLATMPHNARKRSRRRLSPPTPPARMRHGAVP